MRSTELLVAVGGLVVGYWVISMLMSRRTRRTAAPGGASETADGPFSGDQPADGRVGGRDSDWIRANWHEVLGVSPNASIEVVKSAYRLRAQQYHPDKTERLGPELKSLAMQKMQELNVAYTWATRSRRGR
jgi:DnaJ-domain-containing protein 1